MNRIAWFHKMQVLPNCFAGYVIMEPAHPLLEGVQIAKVFARTQELDTLYWYMTGKNPKKVWR